MRRMWGCEGLKHCGACILMEANQRNSVKNKKLMFPQLIHRVCFVVSFNEYLGGANQVHVHQMGSKVSEKPRSLPMACDEDYYG